jgi:hypothetical protein
MMKIHTRTQHLLERANRALFKNPQNINSVPFSAEDVARWRNAIATNCPADWRFSENPKGDFLLTVVTNRVQIKILGRSYRQTRRYRDLHQGVIAAASSDDPHMGQAMIDDLTRLYLEEQCQADAEICHDLKTVLKPTMVPTSAGRLDGFIGEPHMAVLTAGRMQHNLARRPNAILLDREDAPPELLVRQGRPYMRPFPGADRSISFCVLARLNRSGIEPGTGQLWKTSGQGVAYQTGLAQCWPMATADTSCLPPGFRTDSYWQLPLHLDAWCQDLQFRADNDDNLPGDHSVHRLLCVIQGIHARIHQLGQPTDLETADALMPA